MSGENRDGRGVEMIETAEKAAYFAGGIMALEGNPVAASILSFEAIRNRLKAKRKP